MYGWPPNVAPPAVEKTGPAWTAAAGTVFTCLQNGWRRGSVTFPRQNGIPAHQSIGEQTGTVFGLPAGHASGAKNGCTPPPPEGRQAPKSLLIQMFSVASLFLGA